MMPVLYYVYRLAALHGIPHVDDLLAKYENGNELDGWIAYFKEEDERLQKKLTTALADVRPAAKVPPQASVRQVQSPESVIDMTDPKNRESFLKFVTGAK